jgi:hypothetical protein
MHVRCARVWFQDRSHECPQCKQGWRVEHDVELDEEGDDNDVNVDVMSDNE